MPESAARQHLHEPHEKAAAEREAAEAPRPRPSPAGGPSMFRTAVEAAAGALPDMPAATVEQAALAVLRVALPLHETQHADAWKAAHERAAHFEWELTKCVELLGHFVDHEDDPCSFDHHGVCNQHSGSSLRPCDVAVGRELLARVRGGGDTVEPTSRAICPRCGKDVHVRVDGTLNAHNRPRSLDRCGGSHGAAVGQPAGVED